jgi:hypothetical protein
VESYIKNKQILDYKGLSKYIIIFYKKLMKKSLDKYFLHKYYQQLIFITLKIRKNRRKLLKFLNTLKRKVKVRNKKNIYYKPIFNKLNNVEKKYLEGMILRDIKYKHVTGFRLETSGRLTRRYTASRSVSKLRYKGNLLNIDSSYKGLSSVLLKGNLKSNLQYTKLKSKTRIGSFGIKG